MQAHLLARPAWRSRRACGLLPEQAVDGLFVTGGKPVDTKSCVRSESCIPQKNAVLTGAYCSTKSL